MNMITITIFTLTILSAYGYHDPDLNYHLSQVQKLQGCDDGYSYPTPAVQLTTAGVKEAAPTVLAQPAPAYQYNSGFSGGVVYQAPPVLPQNTYLPQAPAAYQTSFISQSNYATAPKEGHGYATSAGLSSVASPPRTVIPQATYAQAPIIAKVTAAPLIARFSASPAKTTFVSQNFASQAAGSARASLNSYGAVQTGGPVVSQVYAAPSATYATSAALKVQSPQVFTQTQYPSFVTPTATQYNQARFTPAVTQYATSSVSHATSAASASRFFRPAVQQYSAPAFTQYAAPNIASVTHYPARAQVLPVAQVAPVYQYSSPIVSQYIAPAVTQYSQYTGAGATRYNTANVRVTQHAAAPVATQVAVSAPVSHLTSAPVASVKNVHTDFLENYDAHPRYAYEYSVNDPRTGDIKQQKEERDGEVVKGQYSLVEPDGSVRTVDYIADWETGFHADVRNSKDNRH